MGVNVSKKEEKQTKRANEIDNLIKAGESCNSSSSSSPDSSIFSSSSSNSENLEEVTQCESKSNEQTSETGQLEVQDVPSEESELPSLSNQVRKLPNTDKTEKSKSDISRPISDAEKRLRLYENEIKATNSEPSQRQSTSSANGGENRNPDYPSVLRKTRPHIFLKNDDILKVRRTGVFANDPFQSLSPVSAKKPGQSDILYQLGQEGIVKPMTTEERTIGELRSAGILNQTSDDSLSKKIYPRLAPLKVESVWAKVPEAKLAAPWERKDCLRADSNEALPGYVPSASEREGQALTNNESTKLKLKMMNMDLL